MITNQCEAHLLCKLIFKKILEYLWNDKFICRKWKISVSLVCWNFHRIISEFVSDSINLEEGDKDINLQNHWNSKYSLYHLPPKYLTLPLSVYNILFKHNNIDTGGESKECGGGLVLPSHKCIEFLNFFSRLEILEVEFNQKCSVSISDYRKLLSICSPIKEIKILFYGSCDYDIFEPLICRHSESLQRLILIYLEMKDYSICNLRKLFQSTRLTHLHLEANSVNIYRAMLDAMYFGCLKSLKSLVIIYDDAELFRVVPSESIFKALLELPYLEDLYISASTLIELGFDPQWLFHYLSNEKSLTALTLDLISTNMKTVISPLLVELLLQHKPKLKKLDLTTPLFTMVTSPALTTLSVNLEGVPLSCQCVCDLIKMIANERSNLRKLKITLDSCVSNLFIARLINNNNNRTIRKLKSNLYKNNFQQILEAIRSNSTLTKLYFTNDSCGEINQEIIQLLLLELESHPTIDTLIFESKCKFNFNLLSKRFRYYHNRDNLIYSCFKINSSCGD